MKNMDRRLMYKRWLGIKRRVTDACAANYKDYGGRGIKMCEEWLNSFEAFYYYVGNPPERTMTLDRINNDGDYEPGNIRWATKEQQSHNTRLNSGHARRIIKRAANKTGYAGVRKHFNDYAASIRYRGKEHLLGVCATPEAAHELYLKAAKDLGIEIQYQ